MDHGVVVPQAALEPVGATVAETARVAAAKDPDGHGSDDKDQNATGQAESDCEAAGPHNGR